MFVHPRQVKRFIFATFRNITLKLLVHPRQVDKEEPREEEGGDQEESGGEPAVEQPRYVTEEALRQELASLREFLAGALETPQNVRELRSEGSRAKAGDSV